MILSFISRFVLFLSLGAWSEARNYEFGRPIHTRRRLQTLRNLAQQQVNEENHQFFRVLKSMSYTFKGDTEKEEKPGEMDFPLTVVPYNGTAVNVTLIAQSSAAMEDAPITSVEGSFQSAGIAVGFAGLAVIIILVSALVLLKRRNTKLHVPMNKDTLELTTAAHEQVLN